MDILPVRVPIRRLTDKRISTTVKNTDPVWTREKAKRKKKEEEEEEEKEKNVGLGAILWRDQLPIY
jgi:hypothetical protein